MHWLSGPTTKPLIHWQVTPPSVLTHSEFIISTHTVGSSAQRSTGGRVSHSIPDRESICLLFTEKLCSATTGVLRSGEETENRHLYWPRLDSCRLGRRKTASPEVDEASTLPAWSSSVVSTVAEVRLSGTVTVHCAVNGLPSIAGSVMVILRSGIHGFS